MRRGWSAHVQRDRSGDREAHESARIRPVVSAGTIVEEVMPTYRSAIIENQEI